MSLFKVKGLSKSYNNEIIFENVSFTLPRVGIIGLVGESGSGKSTLLKCLLGIEKFDKGEIYFENKKIKDFSNFRNTDASIIYQNYNLISFLNGYQNISLGMKDNKDKDIKRKLEEAANSLEIKDKLYQKVETLSGGEKQRIAILRSYITSSKIIFCDEPTGSLDEENGNKVMEILKKISSECLVFLVTHNNEYLSKYCTGYLKIEDKTVKKIYIDNDESLSINKNKPHHLSFLKRLLISIKMTLKNKSKLILSILSLSLSISFLLLSMNASSSIHRLINQNRMKYMDYNLMSVYVESINKIEDSNFSLVQMVRPNTLDKQYLSPYIDVKEYKVDLRPIYSSYPSINFPIGSKHYYSNIEFVPYSSLMEESMNKSLKGQFPTSFNEVLINEPASKIIRGNSFYIDASKEIDYKLEDNTLISDTLSLKTTFKIVGVIKEFSLLETPRIYYSYSYLERIAKDTKLYNLSSYYEEDISLFDRLGDLALNNDNFASNSLLVEVKDINKVYEIYKKVNNLKIKDRTYVIESTDLFKTTSFETLFSSIKEALNIFVGITILISVILLSLCLFSFISDYKKDIGIMFSMGIPKLDLITSFILQGLEISLISLILGIIIYLPFTYLLNDFILNNLGVNLLSLFPSFISFISVLGILILVSIISNISSSYAIFKLNINDIIRED